MLAIATCTLGAFVAPHLPASAGIARAAAPAMALRDYRASYGASMSWEYAAASVFWDAHYQLALFHLTWALDLSEGVTASELPALVDAYASSTRLLDAVFEAALHLQLRQLNIQSTAQRRWKHFDSLVVKTTRILHSTRTTLRRRPRLPPSPRRRAEDRTFPAPRTCRSCSKRSGPRRGRGSAP